MVAAASSTLLDARAAAPPGNKAVTITYDEAAKRLTIEPPIVVLESGSPRYGVVDGIADSKQLFLNGKPVSTTSCDGGGAPAKKGTFCFALPVATTAVQLTVRPAAAKPGTLAAAKPGAPPPTDVTSKLIVIKKPTDAPIPPGIVLELGKASSEPMKLGAQVSAALAAPTTPAVDPLALEPSLKSYCGHPIAVPGGKPDNCAGAAVRVKPDGSMAYDDRGELGSFCLVPDPAWGERRIARFRDLTQSVSAASCLDAEPGTTYSGVLGTKERPVGRLEIWADRAADDAELKKQRDAVAKDTKDALAKYLHVFAVQTWARGVLLPDLYTSLEEAGEQLLQKDLKQADIDRFTAVRKAMSDAVDAYFGRFETWRPAEIPDASWKAELKAGIETIQRALPDTPWTAGLRGDAYRDHLRGTSDRLEAAIAAERPKIADAAKLVRAAAVANQPAKQALLPWAVFSGDYPISSDVKVLPLEGGKGTDTDSKRYYEDTHVLLFAYGVDAAGTAAVLQTDEKVSQEPSDVAKVLSGILRFAVEGGAKVISPAGALAPQPGLEQVCNDVEQGNKCNSPVCASVTTRPGDWKLACRAYRAYRAEDACRAAPKSSCALESACCRQLLSDDSPVGVLVAVQNIRHDLASVQPGPAAVADLGAIKGDLDKLLGEKVLYEVFSGKLESVESAPSAKKTSVARLATLQGGIAYQLQICNDAKDCNDKTDAAKITTRRKIKVYKHASGFSVALELGLSAPLSKKGETALPVGGYRYEAVESATNPQQLYQLRAFDRASDHITISTLFVVYPCALARTENEWLERLGLGFGPTLWRAGAGEFGKQWNLRVLWGPPKATGLLLGAGLGLQWINVPAHVPVNSYVSVPAGGDPPDFRTDNRPQLLFTGGLSLDLGIVTTVTDEIIGKIKGSGSKEGK